MPDLANRLQAEDGDAFRTLIESAPAMLWLGDAAGRCVFLSRELRRFWGVDDEDLGDFDWGKTVHADDLAKIGGPFAQAMADRASFDIEARYRRFDGVFRILRTSARPRFSSSGVFLGMAGLNTDVTEQREAEEALRRSSEHLQFSLDASQGIGTWVWDVPSNLVVADHRFAKAFGVSVEDAARGVPIDVFFQAILEEDLPLVQAEIQRSMRDGSVYRCEYRVRGQDGSIRWLLATGRCELDREGKPIRFPGAVVDISERKEIEEHKDLLANELSHRIKNIFTVVQGMTAMAAREHASAREPLEELSGRFRAMSASYACVMPSADGDTVSGSLHDLLDILFAPYAENGARRVQVEGPDVRIGQKAASSLALILHERATNAAKYGPLGHNGFVRLEVTLRDGFCCFDWRESGGPEIQEPPQAQGFGSRLIRSAVASLDGEMDIHWARDGLRWTMTVSAEKLQL